MLIYIPQNAAPDIWSWTEFLRAVTGPILAAVFVVVGIALKERYDRRRNAQWPQMQRLEPAAAEPDQND